MRDLIAAAAAADGIPPGEVAGLDGALAPGGVRLDELVGALGGEGVVGLSLRHGIKTRAELEKSFAVVLVQEIAEPKVAEQALAGARKLLALEKKIKLHPERGGFTATLAEPRAPFARVRLGDGRFFAAVGQKDLVERAFAAVDKGKGTLGDDAAHARALAALPDKAELRLWADLGRGVELAAALGQGAERTALAAWRLDAEGPKRLTSATSLRLVPDGSRLRVELDEVNGFGLLAVPAIYGVRRYLANAKTAEAKNALGAIARLAAAAYEREQLGAGNAVMHSLCKSARSVPATVPSAAKYQPSARAGADYQTGDDASGWRCLRFEMSQPQYYRYTYTAGGPYKGPARGGPDPGPDGFEIAAEADLDGNGVTSLFTRVGHVDKAMGSVVLAPQVFIVDEYE